MILRGIKLTALAALTGVIVSGCAEDLPGGETGPFAPGNTLTFYYQSVLTNPPDQARIVSCGDQFIPRTCVQLSNGAQFQLESTETGVAYGNAAQQVVLQLDDGGVPSGIGLINNIEAGITTQMRWVSLPS